VTDLSADAPSVVSESTWPATLIVDKSGVITHWSRGAQTLFNLSREQVLRQSLVGTCVALDQRATVMELLELTSNGSSWSGTMQVLVNGLPIDVECAWRPMSVDDQDDASLVILTDTRGPLPIGTVGAVVDAARHFHGQAATAAARGRLALLNDASTRIGTTLDTYHTAREVMDVAIPRLADAGSVLVLESLVDEYDDPLGAPPEAPEDSAVLQRLALGAANDYPRWAAAFPVGEVVAYDNDTPYAQVLHSAKPQVVAPVDLKDAEKLSGSWPRQVRVTPLLARHSLLIVPLIARGSVLGLLVLNREPGRRPFADSDLLLGEELAARAALCLDNARLYSRERRTALMLQQSLLPDELTPRSGIEVAHRYLPSSDAAEVGGDWYDMIPLSGSRVAFAVGDVMGHGVQAAAIMGQLRTTMRTLASLDLPPTEVLRQLDESTQHLGGTHFATCVYATYDPVGRVCEIARAGHPPPVLVGPDGEGTILDLPAGLPLGIGGAPYESVEFPIPDGSVLALCSDGLVESRERDVETGLEIMRDTLSGVGKPLEDLADELVTTLFHQLNRDDTALLLARLSGLPSDAVVSWLLPAVPQAAGQARRHVRAQLANWGLDAVVDMAELLASELVTNAVRYGSGPIGLRLVCDETLLCEISDTAEPQPRLYAAGPDDVNGRGLQLVNRIATRWGTRRISGGKTVWFELELA
jgi:serine phosphatase RsbU (regulator of sigma subunit)